MEIVATRDFESLVADSFNDALARDAISAVDQIFDFIYMMIFTRFHRIKEIALEYKFLNEWEDHLPNTMSIIKTDS